MEKGIKVIIEKEAQEFLNSIEQNARDKFYFLFKKVQQGQNTKGAS